MLVTGKSLSKALILASTNPQHDKRLFIELWVMNCSLFLFWHSEQFMYTTCSELVIFMCWTRNSMNNLLSYWRYCNILWVSWCKKKCFWKKFTCTVSLIVAIITMVAVSLVSFGYLDFWVEDSFSAKWLWTNFSRNILYIIILAYARKLLFFYWVLFLALLYLYQLDWFFWLKQLSIRSTRKIMFHQNKKSLQNGKY